MLFRRKKHKRKNKNKHKASVLLMLSLVLSAPTLSVIEAFTSYGIVKADENESSTSSTSDNNSTNNDSSNSSDSGTQGESENNDQLKTGVSKNGKGNELFKNLDDAKNDIYNTKFPSGVRSSLLNGALKYNEGMQLLMTYQTLKDQYGGTNYHDLMNGSNNEDMAKAVKKPASGIKIDIPKSFGNKDMINLLSASNSATNAIEDNDKGTQTAINQSGNATKDVKNGLTDTKMLKALEPLAKVMATNFLNACALRKDHPATYSGGSNGAIALMPVDFSDKDYYSNSGNLKPNKQLIEAFEGAIAQSLTDGNSLSELKGSTDKETKENIKTALEKLTLEKMADGRFSNVYGALGKDKFPQDGAIAYAGNGDNIGGYGITYSVPNEIVNLGHADLSGEIVGYKIKKTKNKNVKITVTYYKKENMERKDKDAVNATQYLTPQNKPTEGFDGTNTKKWLKNYKRLMAQPNSSDKDAQEAINKISESDAIKDLVKNSNSDEKVEKATTEATKGLQMLGWNYSEPRLSKSKKETSRKDISATTWKIAKDGKFMSNGQDNDGKGLISQVRFIFPALGSNEAKGDNAVFKLYDVGSVQMIFGQNSELGQSDKRTADNMIGYGNANSNLIDSIKNSFDGKLRLKKISNDDLESGKGADKDFSQATAFKYQRYITGSNSYGKFTKNNGTDAVGFDNYGNLIDGGTAKVIVPYWQNGLIPQFENFTKGKKAYLANPILNDSGAVKKMDGMKGVFGKGNTGLVGKVSKEDILTITKSGSEAYKNAVAVSKAIDSDVTTAQDYIKAVNKAVGKNSSDKLSDKACQALAICITAGTKDEVSAWNTQFLALCGQEKHLYTGNSLTDVNNKSETQKKSKYNNLFTVTDIVQYVGLMFQRGGSLMLRKTVTGLISNTYNSTFAQSQSQNVFYTPTFNFLSLFFSMPIVVAFIIAILMILIAIVTWLEYAFLGVFKKSKILVRLGLFLLVIPYFMVYHSVSMEVLNGVEYKLMSTPLKQEAVLDQYANVRQETALNNVFYSAMFGDKFSQINKSTSYAIPFYTTTQVDGTVDGTQGKNAQEAMKNMNTAERGEYLQSQFIKAQTNNGNGKLPFGTEYKYKKVYVASSDLMSWAIHMTRQKMSADGKIKKGSSAYETPSNGYKPGEEPLFTWLAKDYKPLGTSVESAGSGKEITENKEFLANAIFGYGGTGEVVGYGGGDPTLPSIKGNAEKIYKQALKNGATPAGAAAMVGNADQEASCDPTTDVSAGFGIFQWTSSGGRREKAKAYAGTSVEKQVDFAFKEMKENSAYKQSYEAITKSNDVENATSVFCSNFERAGDPRGDQRITYAKKALEAFGNIKVDASDKNDDSDSKSDNNSSNNSNESYDPKDFWQKLNPAESAMKSAYGKNGYGASNGTENNNADLYKDFDKYQEFMVQTNHKATPRDVQLGVDNSTTDGGWLSASQLFLRIWQTTFTDNKSQSGITSMDKFNGLKNLAVALNGYRNIPTDGSNKDDGLSAEMAKQFTQADRNVLIDDLSETKDVRMKLHGQEYSEQAKKMMSAFNIPTPTDSNDWLNLSGKDSPLNMVLPYYGKYSGRSSRQYDIEKINKKFLNSYINQYSLVRASLDPDGKDSSSNSKQSYNKYNNTYVEDGFSMAEAQVMAIQEWFAINEVANIKVFPTNYAPHAISLDTFNRILFEPIGEVGKELNDKSEYNPDDYNNESPVRMQDNVIEFLSVRNNVFTLFVVLIMNYLLLAFGMVMMLLVKYVIPIISVLAFIRIFFAPNDDGFKFKNLLIGSYGLLAILAFFKIVLSGTLSFMSTTMNQEYALAGTYVRNHTFLNAFVISLICVWFFKFIFKDWWGMVKQNGILSLGASDSAKDYFKRSVRGMGSSMPIVAKVVSTLGGLKGSRMKPAQAIRNGGRKIVDGFSRSKAHIKEFAPKVKSFVARKKASISNKVSDSTMLDKTKRQLRNGKLMQSLGNMKQNFNNVYHATRGNNVKGILHGLTNASIATAGMALHGVKPSVLNKAIKGTEIQTPTRLQTLKYSLKDLDNANYQRLKKRVNELDKNIKFDDAQKVAFIPSDRNSMRSIAGRAEAFSALTTALNELNRNAYKVAKVSRIQHYNVGENALNDRRINLGHVPKYRAKQVMERVNDIFSQVDGQYTDYINGDSRLDHDGNRYIQLKHVEDLDRATLQKVSEMFEKDRLIRRYLSPTELSSMYNRKLDLNNTGVQLSDDSINKLASLGIRYSNGALLYNNKNKRQNEAIDRIVKQSEQYATHNDLNKFGSELTNTIANPTRAFESGNLSRTNSNLDQAQYKVGDINKATKQLEALHKINKVNYQLFNKAIEEESNLDKSLQNAFVNNGRIDLRDKANAYIKALDGLEFVGKKHVMAQLDQVLENADKISGARSAKRVDKVFDNINNSLAEKGLKNALYNNLGSHITNVSAKNKFMNDLTNTENMRNKIFDEAHLNRAERMSFEGMTPEYIHSLSATAGKLKHIKPFSDTNTMAVQFEHDPHSGIAFDKADENRLKKIFRNT